MESTTKRLKAIADPVRLRMLLLLAGEGELCVCELQQTLSQTAPTASRNLKILEEAGWVTKRRDGRWMHYRVADLSPAWISLLDRLGDLPDVRLQAEQDAESRTSC